MKVENVKLWGWAEAAVVKSLSRTALRYFIPLIYCFLKRFVCRFPFEISQVFGRLCLKPDFVM